MDASKPIILEPSVWDTDNLGDLIAEGSLHIDDLSLRAVVQAQREELRLLSLEWDEKMEAYWNSFDLETVTEGELAMEEEEVF